MSEKSLSLPGKPGICLEFHFNQFLCTLSYDVAIISIALYLLKIRTQFDLELFLRCEITAILFLLRPVRNITMQFTHSTVIAIKFFVNLQPSGFWQYRFIYAIVSPSYEYVHHHHVLNYKVAYCIKIVNGYWHAQDISQQLLAKSFNNMRFNVTCKFYG